MELSSESQSPSRKKKNKSGNSTENNKQKSTPTGLILLFALLALVGYQTLQLDKLPSFDLSISKTTSIFATEVGNFSAVLPPTITTGIRRIKQSAGPQKIERVTISLDELTESTDTSAKCVEPMVWQTNKPVRNATDFREQRIPFYIHQTSRLRCIHRLIHFTTESWKYIDQYEYYFHDDDAIWRLVNQPWPEFPHLHTILRCLKSMTAVTDLWRLLVLWEYGGIYVDLDSAPVSWTPDSIKPSDDAYFVVENYDAPSQYFMAAAPRHPVVYYAIHQALSKIMSAPNVQKIDASYTTGPYALLDGFTFFMLDVGLYFHKPIRGGYYHGRYNRSVTIDGYGRELSNDIIRREAIRRERKMKMYRQQNMSHFLDELKAGRKSQLRGRSCFAVAYDMLIGPPSWFVAAADEDRMTVGGYS